MSLLSLSLSTIRRSCSTEDGIPSLELIPILREILYRSDDPTAIQEALYVLKHLCWRCLENKELLCERKNFLSQLFWILRTKGDQAPPIYSFVPILIIICEQQLGKENITTGLVENVFHIRRGLKHAASWYSVIYTLLYITEDVHHGLKVFCSPPAPGKLNFIHEMVVWLFQIYAYITKERTPSKAATEGLTLVLKILCRCAFFASLREKVASALANEGITGRRGIALFPPALIIQQKRFNDESRRYAMTLMSRIAHERPLQGWHLYPYFNFFNNIREYNWDLNRYR